MSETQQTIGKILTNEEERDAIHVAVLPAIAVNKIGKGKPVNVHNGRVLSATEVSLDEESIGIADPFLPGDIEVGQRFWVFLYPNTVTGMKHHWKHPKIDTIFPPEQQSPEAWLRAFAARWNFDYDAMIDAAVNIDSNGHDNYIIADGVDLHSADELGEDYKTFWSMLEKYTGKSFGDEHREKVGWSCSC